MGAAAARRAGTAEAPPAAPGHPSHHAEPCDAEGEGRGHGAQAWGAPR